MIWLVIISLILTFLIMILESVFFRKRQKPKQYKKIENETIVEHSGENIRDG